MSKFEDFQRKDRRLVILLALEGAAEYKANHFLLHRWCSQMGHSVSQDQVMGDLAWLSEQGLITVMVAQEVTIATITQRGLDVANARTEVPGVARPAPGQD